MNIVYSLWTKPCTDGKAHGFRTVSEMVDSLILSVNVSKIHYDNIFFYTDKLGYEWIKSSLHKLPFSKIEVCLDEMNWLDDKYWSLVKIFVYQLQKEPFVHIDNDVYLWDKLPDELINHDFFFQEIEWFHEMGRDFYIRGLELYKPALDKDFIIPNAAFNCGIFGCTNQKSLALMKKYHELGLKFVEGTKKIQNLEYEEESKRWLATVIIEQVVIYSLIVNGSYSYDVLLHHMPYYDGYKKKYDIKYTHTLAHHKRHPLVAAKVRERVEANDWRP